MEVKFIKDRWKIRGNEWNQKGIKRKGENCQARGIMDTKSSKPKKKKNRDQTKLCSKKKSGNLQQNAEICKILTSSQFAYFRLSFPG